MSMGPTIDATAKGANANSFVTVAEADTYHLGRFHNSSDWYDKDPGDKAALLVWSTRLLNRLQWNGSRSDQDQALAFPRSGLTEDGISIDSDTIPNRIKEATSELAFWLAKSDRMSPETGGVLQRLKVDVIELNYDTTREDPEPIPKEVMTIIGDWTGTPPSGGAYTAKLVRT